MVVRQRCSMLETASWLAVTWRRCRRQLADGETLEVEDAIIEASLYAKYANHDLEQ
jgi:hypothetical protein